MSESDECVRKSEEEKERVRQYVLRRVWESKSQGQLIEMVKVYVCERARERQ